MKYEENNNIKAHILGKLEYFNPSGSVKDRAALNMIKAAERDGILHPGFPDAFKAPFIVGFGYDECIDVKGEDAYALGREIAKTDGVFLGQSAAAALYAASQVAKRPENEGKNIVAILADNGMKYLSTNMYPLDKRVQ